eukprot:24277-Eustigmatos_ZCMA.PRE.1
MQAGKSVRGPGAAGHVQSVHARLHALMVYIGAACLTLPHCRAWVAVTTCGGPEGRECGSQPN